MDTDKKVGPAFLLIDVHGEASQTLDGFRIKNLIFRGVKILYKGGPVTIENVYFVNCEFQFIPTQKSRQLGRAILASAAVTFDSGKA